MSSVYKKSSSDDLFGTSSFGGGGGGGGGGNRKARRDAQRARNRQRQAEINAGTRRGLDDIEAAQCGIIGATAGATAAMTGVGAPASVGVAGVTALGCIAAESLD